jgi:hypothetical protein
VALIPTQNADPDSTLSVNKGRAIRDGLSERSYFLTLTIPYSVLLADERRPRKSGAAATRHYSRERSCTKVLNGRWAINLRMSTMVMEFDAVPVTPARPLSSGHSSASPSARTGFAISTLGLHSISPTVHANLTFDGDAVHGELLTSANRDATELEFSLEFHLVILLVDGIPGGFEWRNGSQTGKLSTVAPNTILFTPDEISLGSG